MTIYVIVGENRSLNNISARAAYSIREKAEAHLANPKTMWFDDRAVIVELELDKEYAIGENKTPEQVDHAG